MVAVFGFYHFSYVTLFHQFSVLNLLSHRHRKNHFNLRYVAGGLVGNKASEVALFISNAYCYNVPGLVLKLDFPFSRILNTLRVEAQNCIEKSNLKSFVKSMMGLLFELIAAEHWSTARKGKTEETFFAGPIWWPTILQSHWPYKSFLEFLEIVYRIFKNSFCRTPVI